jgi:hypothetical protein
MKLDILLEDVTFSSNDESVDQQIDELIYDAERVAVQKAMKSPEHQIEESVSRSKLKFLLEDEEQSSEPPPFDIGAFANEIIRCLLMYEKVTNIPGIIDIPTVIIARTKSFLKSKYGDEMVDRFEEIVKKDVHASKMIKTPNVNTPSGPPNQPLAVGASSGGGGGA